MRGLFIALISSVLCACSSLDPIPITQDNKDTARGIRYFETRPVIFVQKPFPLAAESILVNGIVSPDGSTIYIDGDVRIGGKTILTNGSIAAADTVILPHAGLSRPPNSQSDDRAGASDTNQEGKNGNDKDTLNVQDPTSKIKLSSKHNALPIFPVNQYVTIVFLPDPKREFAIPLNEGFGTKEVEIVRGPGGTLLSLDGQVDNSTIQNALIESFKKLVTGGTDSIIEKLGLAAPAAQSSEEAIQAAAALKGRAITFRLHLIKYATPGGPYPVIRTTAELSEYKDKDGFIIPPGPMMVPYQYFGLLVVEPLVVNDPLGFIRPESSETGSARKRRVPDDPGTCDGYLPRGKADKSTIVELLAGSVPGLSVISVTGSLAEEECFHEITLDVEIMDGETARKPKQTEKRAIERRFEDLGFDAMQISFN